MKLYLIAPLLVTVAAATFSMQVLAQDHDNHQYVRHDEWKKGSTMRDEDWKRGEQVDYRQHHLRAPPHGYEWRMVDGNYVLAAVATGLIASVIAATAVH